MKSKTFIFIVILIIVYNANYIYYKILRLLLLIKLQFSYTDQKYLYNNFNKIFKNIKNINTNNFITSKLINVNKSSLNQYKIVNMIDKYDNITNIIDGNEINKNIKDILISCLKNVHVNGSNVNLNECIVVDLIYSDIQTFPSMHTDIEWGFFNNSDGFQVWYLYENDDNVGNMFIFDTPNVISSSFILYENNSINIFDQCTKNLIKEYNNIDGNLYYLNMKKGDCLIFGKNLYHMSDFRKSKYRYCLNFRVIIKDSDGGIPVNTSDTCLYNKNMWFKIKRNKIKTIGNKIYPNMFDLLHIF